jgi:hypothetical protein
LGITEAFKADSNPKKINLGQWPTSLYKESNKEGGAD